MKNFFSVINSPTQSSDNTEELRNSPSIASKNLSSAHADEQQPKRKNIFIYCLYALTVLLVSCGGGGKKVLVMASGKVDVKGSTINLTPGTGHNEASFAPDGNTISVVSPSGTEEFDVAENGYYILNLKKDTIAGTYQKIGQEGDTPQQIITQDDLKFRIDSLYQLMIAYNIADSNGQYNIPPFTIKKITNNTNAEIIGPFKPLPSSFNPALEHEIYKFYTNKEIWDLILKLHKMTK